MSASATIFSGTSHGAGCSSSSSILQAAKGRHPIEDLQNLRREIDLYDPRLSERPWRIVANKMDLPEAEENLQALRERFANVEVVAAFRGEVAGHRRIEGPP